MDMQYPGFGNNASTLSAVAPPTIQHTILSNGLTVASQDTTSLMSSFAFVMGSGSSFENQANNPGGLEYNGGVTNMMEILAFKSTVSMTEADIKTRIEKLGGMVQCVANRESILFCVDVLRSNVEPALELLADTVLHPLFSQEAIDGGRDTVGYMQEEARADVLSREAVVQAAYTNQPLGNFHMIPADKLELITADAMHAFRAKHLYGENCMLSGAGVEHQLLVNIAQKLFGGSLPSRGFSKEQVKNNMPYSKFVGGLVKNERPLREPFVKTAIAFEVGGWTSKNFTTVCVLQSLLGGGSSFSAGGPGKGMYSRLYRDILNRHYWVEGAEAFISIHENCGVFGIDGACTSADVKKMVEVIVGELMRLTHEQVKPIELSRAKNMLKSMLLMQLESRLVLCEDIARQYITYGVRRSPEQVCLEIDAITADDIMNLAKEMMAQAPAVACVGENLSKLPSYSEIVAMLEARRKSGKKSFFDMLR